MVAVGLWPPRVAVTVADGVVAPVNVPAAAGTVALLFLHRCATLDGH